MKWRLIRHGRNKHHVMNIWVMRAVTIFGKNERPITFLIIHKYKNMFFEKDSPNFQEFSPGITFEKGR